MAPGVLSSELRLSHLLIIPHTDTDTRGQKKKKKMKPEFKFTEQLAHITSSMWSPYGTKSLLTILNFNSLQHLQLCFTCKTERRLFVLGSVNDQTSQCADTSQTPKTFSSPQKIKQRNTYIYSEVCDIPLIPVQMNEAPFPTSNKFSPAFDALTFPQ